MNIAVEGYTDELVVRAILADLDITCGLVHGRNGKADLKKLIAKYDKAARHDLNGWLVIIDLDRDAPCAPRYIEMLLPEPSGKLLLRVAVRAIESWLLADAEQLADYLNIAPKNIPSDPDAEDNPKQTLINVARRCRNKRLREDIVPRANSGGKFGPGYPTRIGEFTQQWRPTVAAKHSESLRRCMAALRNWKENTT